MGEWISVKDERKPPLAKDEESISVTVLLYVPCLDGGIRFGAYLHKSRKFRPEGSYGFEGDVTHWMPLPAAPKEGE